MTGINKYLAENRERFLEELYSLLSIPSISAESVHKPDMGKCASAISELLLKAGADKAAVMPTCGNPVVVGEKIIDPALPTVLVYGHYDVMPADPLEEWHSRPFEPEVRNGRIYGRGANDDKGQLFMHIKAFEAMVATGTLPCNVKFMIEGEEEIGSPSLGEWCRKHAGMVAADVILVSDTSLIGWETPSITCGLRGICYMEVVVTGPDKDLHSGLFGGAVINPANALSKMIASLTDADGRIKVEGFYDDVRELSPSEREELGRTPFDEEAYCNMTGIGETGGEAGYSTVERTGIRPSLDVNGIWGGYTGEGTKTIIPSKATAKISMRLVPHQSHKKIAGLFEAHMQKIAPGGVTVEVYPLHGGDPYVVEPSLPAYEAAAKAMEQTFGKRPLPFYSGGSIPIITAFEKILGIKSILMGFGLQEDAIHSPNESFALENLWRGMETIPYFYHNFSESNK